MADNDLEDNPLHDTDEGEQQEDEIRIPGPLLEYLEGWHDWYNLIVHRGADVAPLQTSKYPEHYVTREIRSAPFPFNIDDTWYCGALILFILVVHDAIGRDYVYEVDYPYPRWAGRVLGRAFLTFNAAVLSTLSFEIIGSILGDAFHKLTRGVEDLIAALLIKYLHWGELDNDGEPLLDDNGNFVWIQDLSKRRELVRKALQGIATLVFNYFASLPLAIGIQIVQPALYFLFSIPVEFLPTLLSWVSLPTPGLDKIQDPRGLWLEYGISVMIQFWLLLLLWLLQILYMAKAERLSLKGWRFIDPQMAIIWHLIRATAMHLLAYTAYQLVCGIIVGIKSQLPQGSRYIAIVDGSIVPFLGRVVPEGRVFAAVLLFFFHWLLRAASLFGLGFARSIVIPYILWQTNYSAFGANAYWPSFLEFLVEDLSVLDPEKRVTSRVVMTALFGLRSSWPARFHLSSVVEDD